MTSHITSAERALIDAAIAQGKTQTIPQGKSSYDGVIWDVAKNRLVSLNPERTGWKAARKNSFRGHKSRQTDPVIQQRRDSILAMAQAGQFTRDIADALNISESTVESDIKAMRKKGIEIIRPKSIGVPPDPQVAERRAKVIELHQGGMKAADIAKTLGVPLGTVYNDASALDYSLKRKAAA